MPERSVHIRLGSTREPGEKGRGERGRKRGRERGREGEPVREREKGGKKGGRH